MGELLELIEDGGFEAGEGEVQRVILEDGAGEGEGFGVSFAGGFFDFWSAGIGEVEHAADFIEGFAGGVIDGAPEKLVLLEAVDLDQHGVASGDDEGEVWRDGFLGDERRKEVALHVVNGVEWFTGGEGQSFGVGQSDKEGGGQAGPACGGEGGDLVQAHGGCFESLLNEGADALGMIPASDFRDDSSEFAMNLDLGGDEGGEEVGLAISALDEGDGGFVTG